MRVYKFTELFENEKDRKLAADLMYRVIVDRPDKQISNAFKKVAEPMPDAATVTATTVKGESAEGEDSLHTLAGSTGISEQELKDVTFRRLSAGSTDSTSSLIEKLLLCNSVEEIDKLGYETFGDMWPGFKPGGATETTTYAVKATAGSKNITTDFKMLECILYPELAGKDVYIFKKFPYITTLMLIITAMELDGLCKFGARGYYGECISENIKKITLQHRAFIVDFLDKKGEWDNPHKDVVDTLIGRAVYVAAYVMYAAGAKCLETHDEDKNDIFRCVLNPEFSFGSSFVANGKGTGMKIDNICSPYSYLLDWYAHTVVKSKDAFKAFSSILGLFKVIPNIDNARDRLNWYFQDANYISPYDSPDMTIDEVYKIYTADLDSPVSVLHMRYLLAVEESFGGIHNFKYTRTKKGFENPYWWFCPKEGEGSEKFKGAYERITSEFADGLTSDYGTILFGHNRELQARESSRVGGMLKSGKWSGKDSFEEFVASDGVTVDYKTELFYTPMCVMDHHESHRSVVYDGFDFSESPDFGDPVQYKAQQYTAAILKTFNDFVASRISAFGKRAANEHYIVENALLDPEYRLKDGRSNIESEVKAGKYPVLITRSCYVSPLLQNGLTIKIAFPTDASDGETLCLYINPKTADRDRQIIEVCAAEAGIELQTAKRVEIKEITFGTNYAPVMPERRFSLEELRTDLLRHTLFTVLCNYKIHLLGQLSKSAVDLWDYYHWVLSERNGTVALKSYLDADPIMIDSFILGCKWDVNGQDDVYSFKRPPLIVKDNLGDTSGYALFSQRDAGDGARMYVRNPGCNVKALERVPGAYINTETHKEVCNSEWDGAYLPNEGTIVYLIQPWCISTREDYGKRTQPWFVPVIVGAAHSVAYISWDEYRDRLPDTQAETLYEVLSGIGYDDLRDLYDCIIKDKGV